MTDDDIISGVIAREGGGRFVDRPADAGGPTCWGVDQASLAAWRGTSVTAADVQALTEDEARRIYRARYIHGPGFDLITNDSLRALVVDTGVLHGPATAARWLQMALGVAADGILGLETVGALSAQQPPRKAFLGVLGVRVRTEVHRATTDPSQLQFLLGWINRSTSFLMEVP